MTETKLKIIDWNRRLFPELAADLEKNGQLQPILIDEDGFVHDGFKRVILCGLEQLEHKVVDKTSECSNIHSLTKIQKKALVPMIFKQANKTHGVEESVQIIRKRYGISRATIYRWLNLGGQGVSNETKSKGRERMYKDTETWNPFKGCRFDCVYCEPSFKRQAKRQKRNCLDCYDYLPHEHPERLDLKEIPDERIIFVCGNGDIAYAEPAYMKKVFEVMRKDTKKGRLWFIQSKAPMYFEQYLKELPGNAILLTTLETNRDTYYDNVSKAPPPSVRYKAFRDLNYPKKIVTVEPIMDFDLDIFADWLVSINPLAVFIGYNSHPKEVPLREPRMEKTLDLIVALKNKGIRVLTKELRKMAYRDFEK